MQFFSPLQRIEDDLGYLYISPWVRGPGSGIDEDCYIDPTAKADVCY